MKEYYEITEKVWRDLVVIPAPSHHEEKRAEYIKNTLFAWGIDAEIDSAKNVVVKIPGKRSDTIVFAAHTDTVFPDTEPMPVHEDEKNLYAPGAGDDTIEVATLMAVLKHIKDSEIVPEYTLLFAFDACEEGLGNLKGVKEIMKNYGKDVKKFYSFDGDYYEVVTTSVGSHRYRVTVKTKGGHSYSGFGKPNAAAVLAKGISAIYDIDAPQEGGKTTYNVGVISGGTSVNTIVQEAEMLCEYRSVSYKNLEFMKNKFEEIFEYMRSLGAEIEVELVGDRPCMKDVDEEEMEKMTMLCVEVQKKHSGCNVEVCSGSTDCNIPHSMGIPAVCVGTNNYGGAHTREEWVDKTSIPAGFEIIREIVENYCK